MRREENLQQPKFRLAVYTLVNVWKKVSFFGILLVLTYYTVITVNGLKGKYDIERGLIPLTYLIL